MNRLEIGKRYTEEDYLSKDEIEKITNPKDVENIFNAILNYRSYYDVETEVISTEKDHYKICLFRNLLSKSYGLEKDMLKMEMKLEKLEDEIYSKILLDNKIKALQATAKYQHLDIKDQSLEKLATCSLEHIKPSLYSLKAYSDAYSYIYNNTFSLPELEKINNALIGEELDSRPHIRIGMNTDSINRLTIPNIEDIKELLERSFKVLDQTEIPEIIRSLLIVYIILSIRPFEFSNEETCGLFIKDYFKSLEYDKLAILIPFEALSYAQSSSFMDRLKTSENSLDLTYFINTAVDFMIYAFDILKKSIDKTIEESIKEDQVEDKKPFALPVFPIESSKEEIASIADKLLKTYPKLKKKQAHFYASHCQIGLFYTIEEFKQCEDSVYETARTSMDSLAALGFYKKTQLGKKFVYTPIPLDEK